MTYTNARSINYDVGTRSSPYNKTATYNTNARSRKPYSLDLRNQTAYNINTRAATPYHAASSISTNKTSSKTPYQAASSNSLSKPALSNSKVPNQVAAGTNTSPTTYAYNVGRHTLTLDTIAKFIAPQQVIYNMNTEAESVINQKQTSAITRPSNSQMPSFNISVESTASNILISPGSQVLNEILEQPAAQKKAPSVTTKPSERRIPASSSYAKSKSTATEVPSSTKQLSQFDTSINSTTSSPISDSFARPAASKPASNAGASNLFVKTRPNKVVRAELIKNKTTKRAESATSVSRVKEDEHKANKKPKPAFKTKLVNKYCTYYHKYGRCKEGDFCAYKHDPNRVEVCKLWLKGSECTLGEKCPLQHVESAHLIPYCRHFCKGMCLKDDCHYTHVKVSKRAPHCKDFMVGRYCPAGTSCRKKHEWGLYEEPTETESEAGKKRIRDPAEDEVEREKIKKLREEMANGVNPFAAGWTFIPIDD